MKTIQELRRPYKDIEFTTYSMQLRYFIEYDLDFDVFLPTRNMNLQRDLVWSIEQKRSLIDSIFLSRTIPQCTIINVIDENSKNRTKDKYQIIDGKQRLTTMIDFYNNKFTYVIDGIEFLCNELPADYQAAVKLLWFDCQVCNEQYNRRFTDQDKIDMFMFINFAGTEQDIEHFNALNN